MLRWLRLSKALYIAFAYVLYLLAFGCRTDYSSSLAPTRYVCDAANFCLYPTWNLYFQPHLDWIEAQTGIIESATPVWQKSRSSLIQFDEKYALSYTLDKYKVKLQDWTAVYIRPYLDTVLIQFNYVWAKILLYYEGSAQPVLEHYFDVYNHHLVDYIDNSASYVSRHTGLVLDHSKRHVGRFFEMQLLPSVTSAWNAILTNLVVLKVADATRLLWVSAQLRGLLDVLVNESSRLNSAFKTKTEFVKGELKNLIESGVGQQRKSLRASHGEVLKVVETILSDLTPAVDETREPIQQSDATAIPEHDDGVASTIGSIMSEVLLQEEESREKSEEASIEVDAESTVTDTVTESIELTHTVETTEILETTETVETTEESEEEPELLTETLWLTATVYESDASGSPEEIATVDVEDLQKAEYRPQDVLELELLYWKAKVDKMLKMAYNSLEDDMLPHLNATLEPLKDEISANFTKFQQDNYQRYKTMNVLIAKINKDSERMRETKQLIEKPEVDRQMMRDEISACRNALEETMKNAEDALNEKHAEIVKQYFIVTQETVDVIESYAETLLQDFNNRLTNIISVLDTDPEYEDKFGWAAWKENHKIKELIFQLRDKIFDEANQYKDNHRSGVTPRGLEPWVDYLISINFHINFLLRDTDEYLQLVRAKANVAYQLREGLTRQFEEAEKAKAKALEEDAARKLAEAKEAEAKEAEAKSAAEADPIKASIAAEISAEAPVEVNEPIEESLGADEKVDEKVDEAIDEVADENVDETSVELENDGPAEYVEEDHSEFVDATPEA